MKKRVLVLILLVVFCLPVSLMAQTEPDDIAVANDEFQDFFYESLLQKGIENHDKAIKALEKCLKLQPDSATIYFELGKNYLAQRNYKQAYESFEKATQIDPTNKWFWVGMYDVCYETRDFNQAIVIVNKLIEFKKEYREDLVSLYMNTQQFDKALDLINMLNDEIGKLDLRENYKAQILRVPMYQSAERINLINQIKKNPKEESNYIALIALYNSNNEEEKAQEIAKKLENEIPTSDWAQVSLFKYHLINKDEANVIKAMYLVLESPKIDTKIKHRILNEFLIFIKDKPQLVPDLDKAISYFDNDKEVDVAKEIGKFYHSKRDFDKSVRYYEMHLTKNHEDIETVTLLLQVYVEQNKFEVVAKKSESMMELFPTQPQFYYFAGLAYNQLSNYKKAIDRLEPGLDFIVDAVELEINFNIQLGEAYNGLGNTKKKDYYFSKAEQLLKQKK